MKTKLTASELRILNKTRAIEKATGFNYVGEATTKNPVNKQVTKHEVFEGLLDEKIYVLTSFDADTLEVELKPKDFSNIKDVEFELV